MSKLVLIGVAATAYVLGAKAGRERYEQIMRTAQRWRNDPRVQAKASDAADLVKDKAPDVRDHVTGAVRDVAGKVGKNGADDAPPTNADAGGAR